MQRHLVIVLFLSVITGYGPVSAQTNGPGDAVEAVNSGKINWTAGEVSATGIGVPPAQPANAAQARAMAERAAFVVAIRNLLEVVKGVRVDSETVVGNFMVQSDVIRTRVEGIVKGARVVKKQYLSDGSVEMLVAMPLKGSLMDTIVPENFGRPAGGQIPLKPMLIPQKPSDIKPSQQPSKPAEPSLPPVPSPSVPEMKPEPVQPPLPPTAVTPEKKPEPPGPVAPSPEGPSVDFKGGVATGLVIDGRGLGLRPALLPRIIDSEGQEIYVGQVVTRTNAVEQGVAGYARDVNAAANNFRVTDNPAVIKGLRASGSARTDIVVAQADAGMLHQLGGKGDFLQNCRVIIVY
ncbi:MAG: hypothetical protein M0R70_13800 [Nitrospirae bacterium]|nr:hypothetical protein [Nitrospirota bacterium]